MTPKELLGLLKKNEVSAGGVVSRGARVGNYHVVEQLALEPLMRVSVKAYLEGHEVCECISVGESVDEEFLLREVLDMIGLTPRCALGRIAGEDLF